MFIYDDPVSRWSVSRSLSAVTVTAYLAGSNWTSLSMRSWSRRTIAVTLLLWKLRSLATRQMIVATIAVAKRPKLKPSTVEVT